EIDAASHTGVGDVREIIENIKYMPVSGKTKVYIIDEVHMLSNSAFNALLKTLEEPPEHALFILATTEANKIPLTILSRCQKYDFKKVTSKEIKASLLEITKKENIEIDKSTLHMIASESDGSLRDSLSLLDQLNTTFDGRIEFEQASKLFGIFDSSYTLSLFKNILAKDPKACLEIIIELGQKGINPKKTAEELLRIARHSVYIKACGKQINLDLTEDEISSINKEIRNFELAVLENIFNQTLRACEDISKSAYPGIALEMNVVKLATLEHAISVDEILDRLEGSQTNTPAKPVRNSQSHKTISKPSDTAVAAPKKIAKETNEPADSELSVSTFIEYIKEHASMTGIYLERADKIEIEDTVIKLTYKSQSVFSDSIQKADNIDSIKNLLHNKYSKDFSIKVLVDKSGKEPPTDTKNEYEQNEQGTNVMNNKSLKEAMDTFGGRIVKVKNNKKGEVK
nr:DNA polymerase III subunit gamma/tau [Candidatus Dadabacteria bacterium]NIS08209.1 DNA polymerase III subunit gamma/tau [Candidatus Dadabacteria bacterium]NIV41476.1 DNA polymerase III subunit gamma/tau [Candidatus Dadabacteria bacterium]NIX15119.1 DNA polymerase III subunit gamma/tau [Candidatus Dadabacteria bacterium]NIY21697.1 DNA polymerase III subunit gamma/tau [Candidatus Dadabacteria bacterium]